MPEMYEYGITRDGEISPHRENMTEDEAREWVRECEEELGFRAGMFKVIRRPVGDWELA